MRIMGGKVDCRFVGWTEGRKEGRKEGRIDGWMDGRIHYSEGKATIVTLPWLTDDSWSLRRVVSGWIDVIYFQCFPCACEPRTADSFLWRTVFYIP